MSKFLAKLKDLGIELPDPPTPSANYIPAKIVGNLVYVSGQIPLQDGREAFVGKVGASISVQQAREAARICAINILAQLNKALGREPRSRALRRPARRICKRHRDVLGSSDSYQRRFGFDGCRIRQFRQACPRSGRNIIVAPQFSCRGRRHI
jgi:hypothetical protein